MKDNGRCPRWVRVEEGWLCWPRCSRTLILGALVLLWSGCSGERDERRGAYAPAGNAESRAFESVAQGAVAASPDEAKKSGVEVRADSPLRIETRLEADYDAGFGVLHANGAVSLSNGIKLPPDFNKTITFAEDESLQMVHEEGGVTLTVTAKDKNDEVVKRVYQYRNGVWYGQLGEEKVLAIPLQRAKEAAEALRKEFDSLLHDGNVRAVYDVLSGTKVILNAELERIVLTIVQRIEHRHLPSPCQGRRAVFSRLKGHFLAWLAVGLVDREDKELLVSIAADFEDYAGEDPPTLETYYWSLGGVKERVLRDDLRMSDLFMMARSSRLGTTYSLAQHQRDVRWQRFMERLPEALLVQGKGAYRESYVPTYRNAYRRLLLAGHGSDEGARLCELLDEAYRDIPHKDYYRFARGYKAVLKSLARGKGPEWLVRDEYLNSIDSSGIPVFRVERSGNSVLEVNRFGEEEIEQICGQIRWLLHGPDFAQFEKNVERLTEKVKNAYRFPDRIDQIVGKEPTQYDGRSVGRAGDERHLVEMMILAVGRPITGVEFVRVFGQDLKEWQQASLAEAYDALKQDDALRGRLEQAGRIEEQYKLMPTAMQNFVEMREQQFGLAGEKADPGNEWGSVDPEVTAYLANPDPGGGRVDFNEDQRIGEKVVEYRMEQARWADHWDGQPVSVKESPESTESTEGVEVLDELLGKIKVQMAVAVSTRGRGGRPRGGAENELTAMINFLQDGGIVESIGSKYPDKAGAFAAEFRALQVEYQRVRRRLQAATSAEERHELLPQSLKNLYRLLPEKTNSR